MNLAIFDIDGTLTNTIMIDDLCFRKTFAELFGVTIRYEKWEIFKEVSTGTDSGMTLQILKNYLKRRPDKAIVEKIKEHFHYLLLSNFIKKPQYFVPVSGAVKAFDNLMKDPDWCVAIATGSWNNSALIKLKSAQIDSTYIPLATSENLTLRSEIVLDAVQQSKEKYNVSKFDQIVYIGDGVWDFRTTSELDIKFVGVDIETNGKLSSLGSRKVINNFDNYKLFYQYLNG